MKFPREAILRRADHVFNTKETAASSVQTIMRMVVVMGNIVFIVLAVYLFSYAISDAGVGERLVTFVAGLNLTKIQFYGVLFVLFTALGALVESVGTIVITVPLLFPLQQPFGIDPVWSGVLLVVCIELGRSSSPIGVNLFVIKALWRGQMSDVVLGTLLFHLIMLLLLAMPMLWPDLVLWLSGRMYQ